jgi:hypothetical protein
MGENIIAPGPAHRDRALEEPEGLDRTPTDPIPAKGDSTPPEPMAPETPAEPVAEPPAEPVETPSSTATLFDEGTTTGFRDRWRELQADFVDDPARAVRNADELVDEIMRELAKRKDGLEERWRDDDGDTEKLRVAMTEYPSFFNQLLNA